MVWTGFRQFGSASEPDQESDIPTGLQQPATPS